MIQDICEQQTEMYAIMHKQIFYETDTASIMIQGTFE